MSFFSLSEFIDDKNKQINDGAEKAENDVKQIEKTIQKSENISDIVYVRYYEQISQRLNHANYNIDKFHRNKSELLKKTGEHIDSILEINKHIKTIADEALVQLNEKYFKNRTLANLTANKLRSIGVTEDDLPPPFM